MEESILNPGRMPNGAVKLSVPTLVSKHIIDGRYLLIAPNEATWVVLDPEESSMAERLSSGAAEEDIADLLIENGMTVQEALRKLHTLRRILVNHDFIQQQAPEREHPALRIQAHLTNQCNLRCPHCYVSSGLPHRNELTLEDWLGILRESRLLSPSVHLSVSGGEPLMVPWLRTFLEAAKLSYGFETAILTNGLLWNDSVASELAPLLDFVAISLDGASEAVHDRVRGKGSFAKMLQGLESMRRASIRVVLNVVLMRSNREDLCANLHDFVSALPFETDIDIANYVAEGRGLEQKNETLEPAEFQKALSDIAAQFISDSWQGMPTQRRHNCGYGQSMAIYANGDVSPCLTPRFIRGNVIKTPVKDLFAEIRNERDQTSVDALPLCSSCDVRYLCGGKCHLPQLTTIGSSVGQNYCTATYREQYYRSLIQQFDLIQGAFK